MPNGCVKCTCKTCGSTFTVDAVKHSRKEVESWEAWASSYYDECPACYKARTAARDDAKYDELNAQYHFPALVTGSEKQMDYAMRLRKRAVVSANPDDLKYVVDQLNETSADDIKALADESHMDVDAFVRATHKKYGLLTEYVCLTETDAGKLIDALNP